MSYSTSYTRGWLTGYFIRWLLKKNKKKKNVKTTTEQRRSELKEGKRTARKE